MATASDTPSRPPVPWTPSAGLAVLLATTLVVAGCVSLPGTGAGADGTDGDGASPPPAAYGVEGCVLFEAVVPGDQARTQAALPPGFAPVDYGTYWGGPQSGDSAISVVWLDCESLTTADGSVAHREVLLGAYVTAPVELGHDDASPFYLFEVLTPTSALRDLLAPFGWTPPAGVNASLDEGQAGQVRADVRVDGGGSLSGQGTFPAGDQDTGTFVFDNFHAPDDGELVRQRLGFSTFPYRVGPVTLTVRGVAPLTDLVGDGETDGLGYHAWDVTYGAVVEQVR